MTCLQLLLKFTMKNTKQTRRPPKTSKVILRCWPLTNMTLKCRPPHFLMGNFTLQNTFYLMQIPSQYCTLIQLLIICNTYSLTNYKYLFLLHLWLILYNWFVLVVESEVAGLKNECRKTVVSLDVFHHLDDRKKVYLIQFWKEIICFTTANLSSQSLTYKFIFTFSNFFLVEIF